MHCDTSMSPCESCVTPLWITAHIQPAMIPPSSFKKNCEIRPHQDKRPETFTLRVASKSVEARSTRFVHKWSPNSVCPPNPKKHQQKSAENLQQKHLFIPCIISLISLSKFCMATAPPEAPSLRFKQSILQLTRAATSTCTTWLKAMRNVSGISIMPQWLQHGFSGHQPPKKLNIYM